MIGFCCGILRIMLIILNVLFFAIGVTILTIGAYLLATSNSITYVTSDTVSGVVLMLIVGLALSGVAVIGVISSALSWKPLIIINVTVLILLIVLELTAGIYTLTSYTALKSNVEGHMHEAIKNYDEGDQFSNFVNFFQTNFRCCGYDNASDWISYYNRTKKLPSSCKCTSDEIQICRSEATFGTTKVWTKGCKEDISSAIDQFGLSLGMLAIGLTIAQIIILVFTVIHCAYKVIEWKKSTYSPNASKIPKHKQ